MFDIYKTIQSTLTELNLPVYNEQFVKNDVTLPCISWVVNSMTNDKVGETLLYDDADLTIKVWTTDGIADMIIKEDAVDSLLLPLGYRRTGSNTMVSDDGIQIGVLNYSCKIKEDLI